MKLFGKTPAFMAGALALSVTLFAVRVWASDLAQIRFGYQKDGTLNVARARRSMGVSDSVAAGSAGQASFSAR